MNTNESWVALSHLSGLECACAKLYLQFFLLDPDMAKNLAVVLD